MDINILNIILKTGSVKINIKLILKKGIYFGVLKVHIKGLEINF